MISWKGWPTKSAKLRLTARISPSRLKASEHIIEGIDQIPKALLGFGDHLERAVPSGGRWEERLILLVEAADKAIQFGNFLGLFPDVNTEENDESDQDRWAELRDEIWQNAGCPRRTRQRRKKPQKAEKR